jgi:hypothetical protein
MQAIAKRARSLIKVESGLDADMGHDDTEYAELPEDPLGALLSIEQRARTRLERAPSGASGRLNYVVSVMAARDEYKLDILDKWTKYTFEGIANSSSVFESFQADVDYVRVRYSIAHGREDRRFSVGLETDIKEKIREYLAKIKRLVDKADLDDRKKEALYARIADLENEVDRNRTRFQALAGLFIEVAGVTGEAAEKLEPVRKWLDSIAKFFGFAKSHEDAQAQLPAPRHPKKIEPPRKQLPKPDINTHPSASPSDALDDDLPF